MYIFLLCVLQLMGLGKACLLSVFPPAAMSSVEGPLRERGHHLPPLHGKIITCTGFGRGWR